jgi:NAD(P)-dependent dehydrogenase (short-subunit alcohol dehydrogenase family)
VTEGTTRGVCLVIGAGDATGGAIARRFAAEGYTACITRRPRHMDKLEALAARIRADGGAAHAYGVDARDEDDTVGLFEEIERDIGPVEVCVFNIGGNVRFPIRETTAQVFRKVWEMCCFAGFLAGREAARFMVPRGRGTILFTGATASLRGGAGFAAFAAGKHGLRAVAEAMARELGPKGVHVAHLVVDAAIDTEWIRTNFPERLERGPDAVVDPERIAETYWQIHCQHRSAWTFETELRPWTESW